MSKNKASVREKKLRDLLDIGERLLVIAERLKRKDQPGRYIKAQPKISLYIIEMRFLK